MGQKKKTPPKIACIPSLNLRDESGWDGKEEDYDITGNISKVKLSQWLKIAEERHWLILMTELLPRGGVT